MATDAFGRLRVSEPFTTFNYYTSPLSQNNGLDQDVWVSTTGGGATNSYNSENYIDMNLPSAGAGPKYVLRLTKLPMIYQTGKSRLIYMTCVMRSDTTSTNVTTHMGLFNTDNASPPSITEGTYFSSNFGGVIGLYWEDRTQTGVNSVPQASWNIDTFDGTGPSGLTLTNTNLTQNLLIVIDQEWLGVGRVRCGFNLNGVTYYAHQFTHSGMSVQYTKTPRLSLGYYIVGTQACSMRQMCCTNMLEGGYFSTGRRNSITTSLPGVSLENNNTKYILLALRINSSYPNGTIIPLNLSVAYSAGTNKIGYCQLQLHSSVGSIGTISAPLTYTTINNSIAQYAVGSGQTVTSDGFILTNITLLSQTDFDLSTTDYQTLLTRMTASQYDTLYVVGVSNTNADTMTAGLDFIEEI